MTAEPWYPLPPDEPRRWTDGDDVTEEDFGRLIDEADGWLMPDDAA